jgi:hypothetical protein
MSSTLSFSGRTIGEQPKIKQNHYNPNKQTQSRYSRLFLLPTASLSLSLSLSLLPHGYLCDSSRRHVTALDLSRFNLSGALSPDLNHLPPCASSSTSLSPPTSSLDHPRQAIVPLCPLIPLFNLLTLSKLLIDLGREIRWRREGVSWGISEREPEEKKKKKKKIKKNYFNIYGKIKGNCCGVFLYRKKKSGLTP